MRAKQVCVITSAGKRVCGRPVSRASGLPGSRASGSKTAWPIARSSLAPGAYVYQLSEPRPQTFLHGYRDRRYVVVARGPDGRVQVFESRSEGQIKIPRDVQREPSSDGVAGALRGLGYRLVDGPKIKAEAVEGAVNDSGRVRASGSATLSRAPAVERFVPLTRVDGVVLLFRGDPTVIQGHTLDHAREYGIDANEYTRFHRSLDSALARLEGRYVYVVAISPNGRAVPSDLSFVRNGTLVAVPNASGKAGFWSRIFGENPAAPPATTMVHVGDYVADSYGTINQITKLRSDGIAETRGLDEYGSTWQYPFSEIHATPKPYAPGSKIVVRGKPYTVREHTNEHVIRVTDANGRKSEIRPALVSRA